MVSGDRSFGFRLELRFRPERFAEGFGKIITVLEIIAGIFFRARKQADFNHVENNFAKIFAVADAPFLKHGRGHWAELLQRVLPQATQQFLSGDVPHFAEIFAANELLREVERLAHKQIRVAMKAAVSRENLLHGFVEIDFLHISF